MAEENPSLVGRTKDLISETSEAAFGSAAGLKALRSEIALTAKVMGEGMGAGLITLATGGNKVRAVWESIKWGAIARAGLAGFAGLLFGAQALAGGIRKIVTESGALQAAIDRLATTKILGEQFKLFLGSVDAAKKRVADLYAFTASSKFNFGEVANASRSMTILSNGILGGTTSLKMLGRISTATGVPLEELGAAYGRLNSQVRNKQDISGTIEQFKEWGVVSEATAGQLTALQQSGAPPASVWDAVDKAINDVSTNVGETAKSIGDLEKDVEKYRESMFAAFGAPFVEQHRKNVELTGQAYKALTPAVAALGQTLGTLTAPFEEIKTRLKSIAATPVFAGLAKQVAEFAPIIPAALVGKAVIGGAARFGKSAVSKFQSGGITELASTALGAISPGHQAERFASFAETKATAAKTYAGAAQLAGALGDAKSAAQYERQAAVLKGISTAAGLAGNGMSLFSKGLLMARAGLVSLLAAAAPMLAFMGVIYAATKLWEAYQNEVAKANELDAMSAGIRRSTEALKDQLKEMKNTDDYLQVLAAANRDLNDAMEARSKIADEGGDEDKLHAADAAVAIAQKNLRMVQGADQSKLAPGQEQINIARQRAAIEKEIQDMVFETELARSSSGKQALMLAEGQAKYAKVAADYARAHENVVPLAMARTNMASAAERDKKSAEDAEKALARAQKELQEAQQQQKQLLGAGAQGEIPEVTAAKKKLEAAQAAQETAKPETAKARTELISRLKTGSTGEQFEAKALEAEAANKPQEAAALREKEADAKKISEEEARTKEREFAERRVDLRKQLNLHALEQDTAKRLLSVTSQTVSSEDVAARIQIAGNNALLKKKTEDYENQVKAQGPARSVDEENARAEAADAFRQQSQDVENQNTDLQKGIDERERARKLEMGAYETAINVQNLNSQAIVAAAKGHYAEADAALLAAQQAEDQQHDKERAHELLIKGYHEDEIAHIQAAETAERTQARAAQAQAYTVTTERRIREMQLETAQRGITPIGGGPSVPTGTAARQELLKMQDVDAFKDLLDDARKGLGTGPGNEQKAQDLATREFTAQIQSQSALQQGMGAIADSLTRVGGGGGFYAGSTGDPQLQATKRVENVLTEIKGWLEKAKIFVPVN